jgi:predicted amidophosphoribosyltransferase
MVNQLKITPRRHALRTLACAIEDWLLPPICVLCGAHGRASGEDLCAACDADLPGAVALPAGPSAVLEATWSAFRYEFPVADMLREVKFHGRAAYARVLGVAAGRRLIADIRTHSGQIRSAARIIAQCDCLLPVPLHLVRLRQRGFNQALEIAKPISQAIGRSRLANKALYRAPRAK